MARLEDLIANSTVCGLRPEGLATVVAAKRFGSNALELTYKDAAGRLDSDIPYRDREPSLEVVPTGRPWCFVARGCSSLAGSTTRRPVTRAGKAPP